MVRMVNRSIPAQPRWRRGRPPLGYVPPRSAPYYTVPIRPSQTPRADYVTPGGEILLLLLGLLCFGAGVVLAVHGVVVIAMVLIVVGGFPVYFARVVRAQRRL
ncbi:hypothetical protein OHB26_04195 [Nocardia sp. NBC_01503]|uniref:hypothetical protein n=1 Tax=Nocardia sp. NBC_01503 TaxID=2975997 RepID=UPI002E7BFEAC|nr:hypothetical protein [Nocardia sp. NBC_01503]WTL33452.1 hypothetical protein OHB26_04195 [Nocardia sp. NBC_01503]